jgi:hypothetical protein
MAFLRQEARVIERSRIIEVAEAESVTEAARRSSAAAPRRSPKASTPGHMVGPALPEADSKDSFGCFGSLLPKPCRKPASGPLLNAPAGSATGGPRCQRHDCLVTDGARTSYLFPANSFPPRVSNVQTNSNRVLFLHCGTARICL